MMVVVVVFDLFVVDISSGFVLVMNNFSSIYILLLPTIIYVLKKSKITRKKIAKP